MLIYPKLTPPEFVSDIEEKSIHMHYFFQKSWFTRVCRGLLVGKLYGTPIVELIQRNEGSSHEILK
jgi:hypothetical protein